MIDQEICGFVNIFKPTGMTSFDVVKKVKKALNIKRVGHLGTLDPAATGVLPIAVGSATKFFDYFLNKDKVYLAMVKFGVLTDTLDSYGKVIVKEDISITSEQVKQILPNFVKPQLQVPPKFSAVKVAGKRAYELARNGEEFEIKPKKIEVYDLELIKQQDKSLFLFKAHVSAGTYIRTLFEDIAKALGTHATTPMIIRTRSGCFNIDESVTLEEFSEALKVTSVEEIFKTLPKFDLNESLSKKILNGVKVSTTEFAAEFENNKKVQNLTENDEFLLKFQEKVVGIYKIQENIIVPLVRL